MRRSIIGLMLTLALTILVAPLLANAQPRGRVPRIGVLAPTSPAARGAFVDGFGPGLRELGWVEGSPLLSNGAGRRGNSSDFPSWPPI